MNSINDFNPGDVVDYDKFKPGDVIEYPGGHRDYVFRCLTRGFRGEPGLNACNISWVERGLRTYGQELYPIRTLDMTDVKVVDHFGDGYQEEGREWYELNKDVVD